MDLSSEIKEKLKIEKKASQSALNNEPDSNSQSLDTNELEIVAAVVENVDKKKAETRDKLNQLANRRLDLQSEMESASDLKHVIDEIQNNFKIYISKIDSILKSKLESYSKSQRYLASFKVQHKLERVADYPESKVFTVAFIGIVFLVEVILNANMFAIGSVLGLLGGVLSSVIISIINIGAGLIAGYFILRKINHVETRVKVHGWLLFALYTFTIPFLFNLLVAHYRAALQIDVSQAFAIAPETLISNPFLIQNFDAWVLFTVGLLVSVLACYKGYTLDDEYPEYGKVDREYKKNKSEYFEIKKEVFDKLNEFASQGIQSINSRLVILSRGLIDYENRILDSDELIKEFNNDYLSQSEESIKTLINFYRDINKKVRNSAAPGYFLTDYQHDLSSKMHSDPSIKSSKDFLTRMSKIKKEMEDNKDMFLDQVSDLRINLKSETDMKFSELESSLVRYN